MNSLENLCGKNANLQRENQELKDLINNLKGEKGRPAIKPNKKEIVCNEKYSAFLIRDRKGHDTIEDILLTGGGNLPAFDILISDDARQFDNITDKRALCWVHEERHYKKTPFFEYH